MAEPLKHFYGKVEDEHLWVSWVCSEGWLIFIWLVDRNTKEAQDDTYNGAFFIDDAASSSIWKSIKIVGYLLSVEFSWEDFLVELVADSDVEYSRLYGGKLWISSKIAYDVLDNLERWCWRIGRILV